MSYNRRWPHKDIGKYLSEIYDVGKTNLSETTFFQCCDAKAAVKKSFRSAGRFMKELPM